MQRPLLARTRPSACYALPLISFSMRKSRDACRRFLFCYARSCRRVYNGGGGKRCLWTDYDPGQACRADLLFLSCLLLCILLSQAAGTVNAAGHSPFLPSLWSSLPLFLKREMRDLATDTGRRAHQRGAVRAAGGLLGWSSSFPDLFPLPTRPLLCFLSMYRGVPECWMSSSPENDEVDYLCGVHSQGHPFTKRKKWPDDGSPNGPHLTTSVSHVYC